MAHGDGPGHATLGAVDKPFPFRSLPLELRLRILESTHLGSSETGGYDARFEELLVYDGKLVHGLNMFRGLTVCPLAAEHASASPSCGCRTLPTALFLVDRQMYHEAAIEVFYPNVYFQFWHENLGATLSFLRDSIPRQALPRIQRIGFIITEAQLDGWCDEDAVASGYPEYYLEDAYFHVYEDCHFPSRQRPELDHKTDWRAVLTYLAAFADLPGLHITVDTSCSSWSFLESTLIDDDVTVDWFRFSYNAWIDIATAMCCELKGLGGVRFEMGLFTELTSWLEREVIGRYNEKPSKVQTAMLRYGSRWHDVVPPWHLDQRLVGSNYHPEKAPKPTLSTKGIS